MIITYLYLLYIIVKTLVDIARLYLDGNITHNEVESKVKSILEGLESSRAVVSFSRQLKRFEKTCNKHFCGFWNECSERCQYRGNVALWKHDVIDIYTPLEISAVTPPRNSSNTSLTSVWLEQLAKQRLVLESSTASLKSSASSVVGGDSCDDGELDDKDLDLILLEAKLSRTEDELNETRSALKKAQLDAYISKAVSVEAQPIIPPYNKTPVTEEEVMEMLRLQRFEHNWMMFPEMEVDKSRMTEEELMKRNQSLELPFMSSASYVPSHHHAGVNTTKDVFVNDNVEIVVGGVPEHFNYPWHLAITRGLFAKAGVNVRFVEVPGGTGEMMRMLRAKEIDIAVALTEGIVANIINDAVQPSDVAIIGTYVSSPLTWGISVDAKSPYTHVSDLYNSKIGISRFGSGSHLMSFLLAEQQGWTIKGDAANTGVEFVVKNNIHKMVESLHDGSSDVFLWETFMTKPFYDSGELRKVGEIVTPWPCFMAATRRELLDRDSRMSERVSIVMDVVRDACSIFKSEKSISIQAIAQRHNLKEGDAASWFSRVAYPHDATISNKVLQDTVEALVRLEIVKNKMNTNSQLLVDTRVGRLELGIMNDFMPSSVVSTTELPKLPSVQYNASSPSTLVIKTGQGDLASDIETAPPMSNRSQARVAARKLALSLVKQHLAGK